MLLFKIFKKSDHLFGFFRLLFIAFQLFGSTLLFANEARPSDRLIVAGNLILKSPTHSLGLPSALDEPKGKSSEAAQQPQSIGPLPPDEEDIRKLFLRQASVLLTGGQVEIEVGLNYLNNQLAANVYNAKFRQFQIPLAFRVGLFDRIEGSVSIPWLYSEQKISFAEDSLSKSATGLGDVSAGITIEIIREGVRIPNIVASVSVQAPTGSVPNEEGLSTGSGHWAGSLGLQFIKTSDPVVLFWGVRYTHEFEAEHFFNDGVYDVQPGETFDYNFGFGFAVNERVSLSAQVTGGYQWQTRADGREISGSDSEPVSLRGALTYRASRKAYVEPSLTIGLNDETADLVIGIAFARRFGK